MIVKVTAKLALVKPVLAQLIVKVQETALAFQDNVPELLMLIVAGALVKLQLLLLVISAPVSSIAR
jgi:hypothetical protein